MTKAKTIKQEQIEEITNEHFKFLRGDSKAKCADFGGMILKDIQFRRRNLKGVSFLNAKLTNVIFSDCNLEGTNFDNANLDNVDFGDYDEGSSNLNQSTFKNAKLNNIRFSNSSLKGTNFIGSNINTNKLNDKQKREAIITEEDFRKYLENLQESKKQLNETKEQLKETGKERTEEFKTEYEKLELDYKIEETRWLGSIIISFVFLILVIIFPIIAKVNNGFGKQYGILLFSFIFIFPLSAYLGIFEKNTRNNEITELIKKVFLIMAKYTITFFIGIILISIIFSIIISLLNKIDTNIVKSIIEIFNWIMGAINNADPTKNIEINIFSDISHYFYLTIFSLITFITFSVHQYSKVKRLRIETQNKIAIISLYQALKTEPNIDQKISYFMNDFSNVIFSKVYPDKHEDKNLPIDEISSIIESISKIKMFSKQ